LFRLLNIRSDIFTYDVFHMCETWSWRTYEIHLVFFSKPGVTCYWSVSLSNAACATVTYSISHSTAVNMWTLPAHCIGHNTSRRAVMVPQLPWSCSQASPRRPITHPKHVKSKRRPPSTRQPKMGHQIQGSHWPSYEGLPLGTATVPLTSRWIIEMKISLLLICRVVVSAQQRISKWAPCSSWEPCIWFPGSLAAIG